MKVVVRNRQCLADIALQVCGSVEAVFAIAERNGLSITDDVVAGEILTYEPTDVADKRVVAAYVADEVYPACAADEQMLHALVVAVDSDNGSLLLEDTTDAVGYKPLTNTFNEQFDITFA